MTLLQRGTDGGTLARVFGIYDQLNVGAIALGSLLAGPLSAQLGARAALVAVAAAGLVLALPALATSLGRATPTRLVIPAGSVVPSQRGRTPAAHAEVLRRR